MENEEKKELEQENNLTESEINEMKEPVEESVSLSSSMDEVKEEVTPEITNEIDGTISNVVLAPSKEMSNEVNNVIPPVVEETTTNTVEQTPVKKPKDKKKLAIIVVATLLVIIIAVVLFFVLKDDNNTSETPKEEVEQPNENVPSDEECKQIINSYGNKVAIYVRDQIAQGNDVTNMKPEAMVSFLDGYEVKCEVFNLDNNGNIVLNNCSINGSEAIYSFEKTYSATKPDTDYKVASKKGILTFYFDGYWLSDEYDEEEDDYKKYTIKCEEDSCVLDSYLEYYAVVKEKSGKINVYNFYNGKKVYTALAGYEVNIIGKYDEDYEEYAFALTLRNPEEQEALYSLEQKKIIFDYGVYTYNWESNYIWVEYVMVYDNLLQVYKNKKVGLVNADTYEVVLEPTEYDKISTSGNFIYVTKGKYEGLLKYNIKEKTVTTLIKPNKYEEVAAQTDHILVKKSGKYGAFDSTGKTQYLNGKFYDAVVIANNEKVSGALVLDDNSLKVYDLSGKLIKDLGKLPEGTKLKDNFGLDDFGIYDYLKGNEVSAWIKLINPAYDEDGNDEYYDCIAVCDELDDDEYDDDCYDSCELLYIEEIAEDCVEYSYNFMTDELNKEYWSCEDGYAKPVLYLYPTLPTLITVTFDNPENLTTTYPKYENSWKVLANKNGDLYDLNDKYYYALYWEEKGNHKVDFSEGFYVTKNNAIEFLEEKLTKIGLNDRERNEFIMYWLPILEENGKSLVYFELTEERESYSKINIQPQPDSLLRVAIHVKKVDSYTKIKEQKLPTFKRSGFTAVEWGGVLY